MTYPHIVVAADAQELGDASLKVSLVLLVQLLAYLVDNLLLLRHANHLLAAVVCIAAPLPHVAINGKDARWSDI